MNINTATTMVTSLCLFTLLACSSAPPKAESRNSLVQLVSAAEVAQYKTDSSDVLVTPLAGDEPAIEIIRPAMRDGRVASPVGIEVRFKPVVGKTIDPNSFKLYYGAFKLDVTDRLLKTAKVTASGFSIDNVDIPSGSHRLIMKVSDDAGSAAFKEIKFIVGG
jgi:hypothetical protein